MLRPYASIIAPYAPYVPYAPYDQYVPYAPVDPYARCLPYAPYGYLRSVVELLEILCFGGDEGFDGITHHAGHADLVAAAIAGV